MEGEEEFAAKSVPYQEECRMQGPYWNVLASRNGQDDTVNSVDSISGESKYLRTGFGGTSLWVQSRSCARLCKFNIYSNEREAFFSPTNCLHRSRVLFAIG